MPVQNNFFCVFLAIVGWSCAVLTSVRGGVASG